ncbi:MAG: DUF4965 domain-containing protein [Verrucomicrobiae bacterium]|nr:DUF4965 domain-containing protein [Verrucomicrobiae bacterium]
MNPRPERIATTLVAAAALALGAASAVSAQEPAPIGERAPAVPLVACDPYFSIWSAADRLADAPTTHWTGKPHRLTSLARIDGKAFRLMGADPAALPALPQIGLRILPTRTVCEYEGSGVRITLTFLQPALPHDIDVLSRPTVYLIWGARATDGRAHAVSVHVDASTEIAVDVPTQRVAWSQERIPGLVTLRAGSEDQPVLARNGDDLRIDWGYLYLSANADQRPAHAIGAASETRDAFASSGSLPGSIDDRQPRAPADGQPVLALALDLGEVAAETRTRWAILAYDDIYSIQYFKTNLRPYWRRDGADAATLLARASEEFPAQLRACGAFDDELMADLRRTGGNDYARLGALAYRQCFGANKFVADARRAPLSFSKENFSNGCIGTVDVMYPMAPQFLLFGPSLTKTMLVPIMDYASSQRWKFPFAPHDLGRYPHANKQRYGGGEVTEDRQMPVEETGNMLILLAALARIEGNAEFAARYWPTIERWAAYLKDKGFDPENQLCTDDFAGHLAHNVNLSAKAICGLAAYAQLCRAQGMAARAEEFTRLAKEFATRWVKEADDGDHFRLAFDQPDTWSQKYNLVWDRILGLDLFPDAALRKEMAFYRKTQNEFGLPLDSRKAYTKLDWILWTATLTGERADFDALLGPVMRFLTQTPDRVPMTDWYETDSAKKRGFQARSVVGGIFLKLLYNDDLWKKWSSRDITRATDWAPFPKPPEVTIVVPAADQTPTEWRYTTMAPPMDWAAATFDASAWQKGKSGFGTRSTPGAAVNTEWRTQEIWLRREFDLQPADYANLHLWLHHDEDAEVFINGVPATHVAGYATSYELFPISPAAAATLRPGKNIIAIHCRQKTGGQYIDAGLAAVSTP